MELSLEEKIGQMLIIRMIGKEVSPKLENMIKNHKIGGIILYIRNYNSNKEMLDIVNKLKAINRKYNNIPLLITTDQEGGRVNRMPEDFKKLKSAKKIAESKDLKLIEESGRITGEMLRESGFHLNFAPVLDIQRFDDYHAIGDRCYGKNYKDVIKNGITIMKALKKEHIIPVVKHFPGHGITKKDSHFFLPRVKDKIEKLEKEDLKPFKEAIKEGAEAIMVGHILLTKIDKIFPITLSKKFVRKYIREKYKFDGLVITDDLKMKSISFIYGYKRGAARAIKAGNDMVMIGASYNTVEDAINKIKKLVLTKKIDEKEIDKSVERILKIKKKYKINDDKAKGANIKEINKRIEKLNNLV